MLSHDIEKLLRYAVLPLALAPPTLFFGLRPSEDRVQVLVFVTDDGDEDEGSGPMLFLANRADASLPPHPRSLQWRYFATMSIDDQMFGSERKAVEKALAQSRPYISQRLVKR